MMKARYRALALPAIALCACVYTGCGPSNEDTLKGESKVTPQRSDVPDFKGYGDVMQYQAEQAAKKKAGQGQDRDERSTRTCCPRRRKRPRKPSRMPSVALRSRAPVGRLAPRWKATSGRVFIIHCPGRAVSSRRRPAQPRRSLSLLRGNREQFHVKQTSRIHAHRAAGGDRHHRRADLAALARRAVGSRIGPPGPVHQQPQADRPGGAQLHEWQ